MGTYEEIISYLLKKGALAFLVIIPEGRFLAADGLANRALLAEYMRVESKAIEEIMVSEALEVIKENKVKKSGN